MLSKSVLALAASASFVAADTIKGFNYASAGANQQSFEGDIKSSGSLQGASGFNSARLYTMIQDGTTNTPISAIPAAISTKGTLLLGLWASAGQAAFDNEIAALSGAIKQYGQDFADTVVGISVGSEDLYRITDTSTVVNKDPNPGAAPDTIVDYIKQVRDTIKGTVLSDKLVGHVDTYTAYINGSNQAVIDNCDFLGMDAYPYYQTTEENGIDQAYDLFFSAYDQTVKAGGNKKPVWVTETGWPYKGSKKYNKAVASVDNAETYWKKVGCALFGKTNVWWYDLTDAGADPTFGILGTDGKPVFDLSCDNSTSTSSSSASSASKTSGSSSGDKTSGSSEASSTGSGSSSGSGSGSAASSSSGSGSGNGSGSGSSAGSRSGSSSSSDSSSSSGSDSSDSGASSGSSSGSGSGSSGSGSGSSGSGSGSSGSGSGSGSGYGAAAPSGGASKGNGTAGITSVTTPSTPSQTSLSTFTGAANRHAEVGVGAMAVLGMLGYFL